MACVMEIISPKTNKPMKNHNLLYTGTGLAVLRRIKKPVKILANIDLDCTRLCIHDLVYLDDKKALLYSFVQLNKISKSQMDTKCVLDLPAFLNYLEDLNNKEIVKIIFKKVDKDFKRK